MMCMWSGCAERPTEYWFITLPEGMVQRTFCWNHANDARGNDRAAFGENYVPGSDEGEA